MLIMGGFGLPFPEDIIIIVAGASVANGALDIISAFLVIYPALLISDFLLFSSGRKIGKPLLDKGLLNKLISREKLARLESEFKARSFLYILFGRSVAGVRANLFILAGVSGMPVLKFVITDCIAAIISVSIMLGIGYLGGNSLQIIMKDIKRAEHVAILILIALVTLLLTFRFYKSKSWRIRRIAIIKRKEVEEKRPQ